ncbi:hypothetical protein SuNHUV7_01460 (plasmid) [Pseudoseohaeicola sp. NH-UV-7]|uniref:DUF1007 family protein n=1 Tax=Sulfitobacter sp. TBRI5 TaxID=2989732 RepID=UPI003A5FF06C
MERVLILCAMTLGPACAAAHPHVFVDTELRVQVDGNGMLTGVELVWEYDDLYSLLLFEDMGLDPDGDGRLNPEEEARLAGFDMNWIEGYEGDLYLRTDQESIVLGPPQPRETTVVNARIRTVHYRSVDPVPADAVKIRAYDPTFYTAYDLKSVTASGACSTQIKEADIDAAFALTEKLIGEMAADADEDAYPEVGEAFASTVVVSCVN